MKRYLIILGAVLFLMGCSNSSKNTEQNLIQNEAVEAESNESVKEEQAEETKPVEETAEEEEPTETEEVVEVLSYEPGEGIITEMVHFKLSMANYLTVKAKQSS